MSSKTPSSEKLTEIQQYIDKVKGIDTMELQPAPTPSCREIQFAYQSLILGNTEFEIVRSSRSSSPFVTYIIYMVKYDEKFWVVPLPGESNDSLYGVEIYHPPEVIENY